jgi:hypothetical protein
MGCDWQGNRNSRRKPAPAPLFSITKSHMTRPGFEPRPPQWEAGDQPPELWRGLRLWLFFGGGGCEAIGTAATLGLLCQPRVIMKMIMEKQMESRLAGETEVLGDNLPQRHFCPSQNPTWPDPDFNPGRRGGKPATNHLSRLMWCRSQYPRGLSGLQLCEVYTKFRENRWLFTKKNY